jgi:endonuclease/exonuclease/phosphatase family metal-dependent hydrolase
MLRCRIFVGVALCLFCCFSIRISNLQAQSIAVLTYNIRYDNANDGADAWPKRSNELASFLVAQNADIIGLQEALHHQVDFLDSSLISYDCFGVGRDDGMNNGEYAPIYWKREVFQLVHSRTVWLSETPNVPSKGWDAACVRIASIVELNHFHSNKKFTIINTHWDHEGQLARQNSAGLLTKCVQEEFDKGNEVILMGDFNCSPNDSALQSLKSLLRPVCNEEQLLQPTFNGFKGDTNAMPHIDDIFVANGEVENSVIKEPKTLFGRQLSDHFPVIANLRYKN